MMRIIAGKLKGRNIYCPAGREIRPTPNLIRGAVFNVLSDRIAEARVLDLFAGAGTLGLEAYSRGAAEVFFVDRDPRAIAAIEKSIARFGGAGRLRTFRCDAFTFLQNDPAPFDVILADPPYRQDLLSRLLEFIAGGRLLKPQGIFMYQHHPKLTVPQAVEPLRLWKSRRHGNSQITFYNFCQES
jgi:16S rRNA (guanine966-N2)-methyltransferase